MSAVPVKRSFSPAELEHLIAQGWGLDLEPFEPAVMTCLGQTVQLIDDDGTWSARIDIEHIGYSTYRLKWRQRFHDNPFVEWLYRYCVIERMQAHIDVKPVFGIAPNLSDLVLAPDEKNIAPAVVGWAERQIATHCAFRRPHLVQGVRALIQFAVEALLPGFTEAHFDMLETSSLRKGYGQAVTLLDGERGPFTASELVRIERALHGNSGWYRERALFYLCRDWGLRPIQIALLRVEDFGRDEAGPYIWVPSVKGVRRSRLRRSPKNLKKRYLTDQAASALTGHLLQNKGEVTRAQLKIADELCTPISEIESLPIPLFAGTRPGVRIRRIYSDPALRSYALHCDSSRISREIAAWSERLMLPSGHRACDREKQPPRMEFSAYRFRRTKATSMVMSGHSPEDVAEALDHQAVAAVRHYFHFNLELIEFVNASHNASVEIAEAVAFWSGRISSQNSPSTRKDMRVSNLGICKATEVCPHHPTVTCYSCPKFRPFKEADHGAARLVIEGLRDRVRESSTGPVRIQVDAALVGVCAVIEAIANDTV